MMQTAFFKFRRFNIAKIEACKKLYFTIRLLDVKNFTMIANT